jgi:hypothetical protein
VPRLDLIMFESFQFHSENFWLCVLHCAQLIAVGSRFRIVTAQGPEALHDAEEC